MQPIVDKRRAWTDYWNQASARRGSNSSCLPDAPPEVGRTIGEYWTRFAQTLGNRRNVIDLGCGSGAVANLLVQVDPQVRVVGVDCAELAGKSDPRVELRSGVDLEALPFPDSSFDAATSQFGIEYADRVAASEELARVLRPSALISFLLHHVDSPIVAHNRRRNQVLATLESEAGANFISADWQSLQALFSRLRGSYPEQDVVIEFALVLAPALRQPADQRERLWTDLAEKLTRERILLDALNSAAMSPSDIEDYCRLLAPHFSLSRPTPLLWRDHPIAWTMSGERFAKAAA